MRLPCPTGRRRGSTSPHKSQSRGSGAGKPPHLPAKPTTPNNNPHQPAPRSPPFSTARAHPLPHTQTAAFFILHPSPFILFPRPARIAFPNTPAPLFPSQSQISKSQIPKSPQPRQRRQEGSPRQAQQGAVVGPNPPINPKAAVAALESPRTCPHSQPHRTTTPIASLTHEARRFQRRGPICSGTRKPPDFFYSLSFTLYPFFAPSRHLPARPTTPTITSVAKPPSDCDVPRSCF